MARADTRLLVTCQTSQWSTAHVVELMSHLENHVTPCTAHQAPQITSHNAPHIKLLKSRHTVHRTPSDQDHVKPFAFSYNLNKNCLADCFSPESGPF